MVLRKGERRGSMTSLSSQFYSKSLSKYFGYTKVLGFFPFRYILFIHESDGSLCFRFSLVHTEPKSDEVVNKAGVSALEEAGG